MISVAKKGHQIGAATILVDLKLSDFHLEVKKIPEQTSLWVVLFTFIAQITGSSSLYPSYTGSYSKKKQE